MNETKISPDNQPAPPDHSSGRNGAVPSSSSDGPSGSRAQSCGGAEPCITCFRCQQSAVPDPLSPNWCVPCRKEAMRETFEPTPAPVISEPKLPYREMGRLVDILVLSHKRGGGRSHGNKDGKRELALLLAREERRNPRHPEDVSFACGCTLDSNPDPTAKNGYPPRMDCVACQGRGKIRDKHHYLKSRQRSVGATDPVGAGRHGYTHADDLDPIKHAEREFMQQGGWHIETAGKPEKNEATSLEQLAEHSHVTRQSLHNYRNAGRKRLQDLPKGGRNDMNPIQLDRIEAKLDDVLERLPSQPDKIEPDDGKKHLRLVSDDESEAA